MENKPKEIAIITQEQSMLKSLNFKIIYDNINYICKFIADLSN